MKSMQHARGYMRARLDFRPRVVEAIKWKVSNIEAAVAWRLTDHAQAVQQLAHRLCGSVPSPEDRARALRIGLLAGSGDLGSAGRLNPNMDDIALIVDHLEMDLMDVVRQLMPKAAEGPTLRLVLGDLS